MNIFVYPSEVHGHKGYVYVVFDENVKGVLGLVPIPMGLGLIRQPVISARNVKERVWRELLTCARDGELFAAKEAWTGPEGQRVMENLLGFLKQKIRPIANGWKELTLAPGDILVELVPLAKPQSARAIDKWDLSVAFALPVVQLAGQSHAAVGEPLEIRVVSEREPTLPSEPSLN